MENLLQLKSKLVKCIFYTIVLVGFSQQVFSQSGVLISPSSGSADASAMLEVKSTSLGLLIPRMTTTQRDAIVSPATGLVVYNSTTNEFNYYNSGWVAIPTGSGVLPISNGGTGATTASGARTNLGVAIGTDVPSATGTGASGTWGINISGNAATATTAGSVTTNANLTGDVTSVGNASTYNNVVPSTKGGAGSVNGVLKANGSGVVSAATSGTDYVAPNGAITGATNTKITYDSKGLVTAGSQAAATDLSNGTTGSGSIVLATSPTLVTPNLGTPSALVGTNITGTASALNIGGNAATATTAGSVTTNANLTGDVTSVGNATTLTNAPVIAKVLTGFTSGAGTVSSTDSILSAFQKINGNDALKAPIASPTFTGTVTIPNGAALGTPASLVGTNITGTATALNIGGNAATATTAGSVTTNANLTGDVTSVGNATTLTNAPVIAKVLTGFTSGAGTVSSTDSILSAFQKINGNDALKAPIASPTFTGTVTIPNGAALGTPASLVGTNITGTAAALNIGGNAATATTAGSVTTNANLTGPITSLGNTTSVASQTGTGSTFVMATSPTLTTPVIGAATGTSLSVSGQLTSTVATGTAPLVVASTTNVPNLNASSLGGATFASPGAIGGTTPAAGTFTQITVNGANANSTISPTGTGTVTISPAGALTINPTAASTINNASIGATTASSGAFTTLTSTGTTSIGSGSGVVTTIGNTGGAAGIVENVGTGNYALVGAAGSTITIANTGVTTGSISVGGALTTGTITIGGTAETGTITLGSSSGTNTVAIGNGNGNTTVNLVNGNGSNNINIGSSGTGSTKITIGNPGTTSGEGLRLGNGRLSINKPTAPQVGLNANTTMTVTDIFDAGIIGFNTNGNRTLTLPSAASIVAAMPGTPAVGDVITFQLFNLGNNNVTLAAGTGITIVNSNVVNNPSTVGQRVVYLRVTNVTPGAEAISVY